MTAAKWEFSSKSISRTRFPTMETEWSDFYTTPIVQQERSILLYLGFCNKSLIVYLIYFRTGTCITFCQVVCSRHVAAFPNKKAPQQLRQYLNFSTFTQQFNCSLLFELGVLANDRDFITDHTTTSTPKLVLCNAWIWSSINIYRYVALFILSRRGLIIELNNFFSGAVWVGFFFLLKIIEVSQWISRVNHLHFPAESRLWS